MKVQDFALAHAGPNPFDAKVGDSHRAHREAQQTSGANQVKRSTTVSGHEVDAEQIQKSFDQSRNAVFRHAVLSSVMLNNNLAHSKTTGGCEHWDEPMTFAVQVDFGQDFSAIGFEAAVVIVQPNTSQRTDQRVEDSAGQYFVPRIMASLLPTADDIESALDLF